MPTDRVLYQGLRTRAIEWGSQGIIVFHDGRETPGRAYRLLREHGFEKRPITEQWVAPVSKEARDVVREVIELADKRSRQLERKNHAAPRYQEAV